MSSLVFIYLCILHGPDCATNSEIFYLYNSNLCLLIAAKDQLCSSFIYQVNSTKKRNCWPSHSSYIHFSGNLFTPNWLQDNPTGLVNQMLASLRPHTFPTILLVSFSNIFWNQVSCILSMSLWSILEQVHARIIRGDV